MKISGPSGANAGPDLRGLLYRSDALISRQALEASGAVEAFAVRNRTLSISGYLHVEDGAFYQFLEGDPAALDALWTSIRRDPRHAEAAVLFDGRIPARRFARWSMGYNRAGEESLFDWTARSGLSLKGRNSAQVIISFLEYTSGAARKVA